MTELKIYSINQLMNMSEEDLEILEKRLWDYRLKVKSVIQLFEQQVKEELLNEDE